MKIIQTTLFCLMIAFYSTAYSLNCRELVVHLQVPNTWSEVYIISDGYFLPVLEVPENGWYHIPLENYGHSFSTKFLFSSKKNDWFANAISPAYYNQKYESGFDFSCATITGTDYYIAEDKNNPGETYASKLPPNAKYLQFLPPQNSKWLEKLPTITYSGKNPIALSPDMQNCGWYTHYFFNEPIPTKATISSGTESLANIELSSNFESYGDTVYILGDLLPATNAFTGKRPTKTGFCNFDVGITYYDTDASLNGAFSCDAYPKHGATSCPTENTYLVDSLVPCIGLTKGIVKPQLGADKKPVYNSTSGCFQNEASFQTLFHETASVNKLVSGTLRFGINAEGFWEYSSETSKSQGFFPLEDQPASGTGQKREGYGRILYGIGEGDHEGSLVNATAQAQFPDSMDWSRMDSTTGLRNFALYPAEDGEFASGDIPDLYANGWEICNEPSSTNNCRIMGEYNQLFCSEIHSTFIYKPGQFLSIQGDDDIWVFINRKLAVDLGGMSLPKPGLANLDTIDGLISGNSYAFDFFQCDRRTEMSNLTITTNIVFGNSYPTQTLEKANPVRYTQTSLSSFAFQGRIQIPSSLQNHTLSIYDTFGKRIATVQTGDNREIELAENRFTGLVLLQVSKH